MKNMPEPKQNQNLSENGKKSETRWVFIAIPKSLVAKRTESFTLIKLARGWSAIINSLFVRNKETEDTIYVSIPHDYKVKFRRTMYNLDVKKFVITEETTGKAWDLLKNVKGCKDLVESGYKVEEIIQPDFQVDSDELSLPDDELPF